MERVIFDNGGGITLQLGDFSHHYDDAEKAASDVMDYVACGKDTSDWYGHEPEMMSIDPSYDQIRNGGYRVWSLGDDRNPDYRDSWGNASRFFNELDCFWPLKID